MIDVLIGLLEGKYKNDQLYLLMFEAEMGELMYGLLVHPGKSVVYYEKIIKVLCLNCYTIQYKTKYIYQVLKPSLII